MQRLEDAQSAEGAKHTARLRGFDFAHRPAVHVGVSSLMPGFPIRLGCR